MADDRSYAPDIFLGICGALVVGYFINSNTSVTTTDDSSGGTGGTDDLGAYGASSSLTAWAQAIQNFENVNPSYNNPGGINGIGDAGQTANGIAIYSSWDVGYNKLLALLQSYVTKNPSMTLDQATQKYAFGTATLNASQAQILANYQYSVQQSLGLDGGTPIAWIGGA